MLVIRRIQTQDDLQGHFGHGPVGDKRVAETIDLFCVTAHTLDKILGVLGLNEAKTLADRKISAE